MTIRIQLLRVSDIENLNISTIGKNRKLSHKKKMSKDLSNVI